MFALSFAFQNFLDRKAAWKAWSDVWALVNAKRPRAEWVAWGGEVKTAAVKFVLAWVTAVGSRTKGLYLHQCVSHLPEFIAKYGDLNAYSSQGMEHDHKHRKQFAPLGANYKPFQRVKSLVVNRISLEHVDRKNKDRTFANKIEALADNKARYEMKRAKTALTK